MGPDKQKRKEGTPHEGAHPTPTTPGGITSERCTQQEEDATDSDQTFSAALPLLSAQESKIILTMTPDEIERVFQETFQLNIETDLRDAALLDYYVSAVLWGQQQKYSPKQMSAFFGVVHSLLQKITACWKLIRDGLTNGVQSESAEELVLFHHSVAEHMPLVRLMKEFQIMLSAIATDTKSEAHNLKIFNVDQGKEIIDYFSTSLFQHFRLYHYMFIQSQTEEIITSEMSVEVPLPAETPFLPSLDEGIPESVFNEFFNLPSPPSQTTSYDRVSKSLTFDELELPPETESIFSRLTAEDVKTIINEVSTAVLNNLQSEVMSKLAAQEESVLGKIDKVTMELT